MTEGEGNCDVLLIKAGTQTQDINVRVRALTVEQYEQLTGKIFDETFPNAEGMYYNIKALNAVLNDNVYTNYIICCIENLANFSCSGRLCCL